MPKIIDKKIKRIALEKYRNGESYNKIASDLDLKSGGQIVRLWIKRYNINNEAFINRKCETNLFMSKDIELKLLKEELKKTQKENEQLKSKVIKEKLKYQLLEKCMPSCTNMTQNQIVIMTRKKA
ncbi:hypothetical protein [Spiroplasma endosymbiont of Cantharis rufa]|uniref:hypothetical protein n=1 Tax=Spiroplasma endosymbiont of Cantharis rufa TaxID=3066279 RepID=UPI0030CD4381